jgi:hypothetical protein
MRIIGAFAAIAAFVMLACAPASAGQASSSAAVERVAAAIGIPAPAIERSRPAPLLAACCRVCTAGKACGNSCIARDKECHQPPGCACDGFAQSQDAALAPVSPPH